jgi:hypothetical protein
MLLRGDNGFPFLPLLARVHDLLGAGFVVTDPKPRFHWPANGLES